MKKNILKITFAAALAVVAGVTAYQAQDKEMMSDLALANVEALARDENTGGDHGNEETFKKGYMASNESGTYTTWSCKGSVNKCGAKCGLCGTEIRPSKGTLTGSHSCSL